MVKNKRTPDKIDDDDDDDDDYHVLELYYIFCLQRLNSLSNEVKYAHYNKRNILVYFWTESFRSITSTQYPSGSYTKANPRILPS